MSINAGVVVVNKFCNSASKLFTGYINYMDREEAIRSENIVKYNLYNDYMGNPEKTSGLFTNMKKSLSNQDIFALKQRFETAQNNGSLMWQTVISFDNQWLEEFGLYSSETKTLNEKKLKELATNGINKMLRNENLEHAVWSGAIHYNTDNIHIHVATVEEYPKRETRMYTQYDYSLNDKNRLRADGIILNLDGTPLIKEEAKGKFKLKSIELCKQSITNEIIKEKDLNLQINQVIRERINSSFRTKLFQDQELLSKMNQLYETLPDCNRSLWNYNNNIMKPYQQKIDDISRSYIESYHSEDFKKLLAMLDRQSNLYRTAYGNSSSDFKETKLKDLYTRMGNSFFKAIKVLDKELAADQKFPLEPTFTLEPKLPPQQELMETYEAYEEPNTIKFSQTNSKEFPVKGRYYLEWEKEFKIAKKEISNYKIGKISSPNSVQNSIKVLHQLAEKGSVLAKYELADLYNYETKLNIKDKVQAEHYYQDAFAGYLSIYQELPNQKPCSPKENENLEFVKNYTTFRLGQFYNKGLGIPIDYQKAAFYFHKSNTDYAKYALGELYYNGFGVEQNYELAVSNYQKALELNAQSPYAAYRLGQMYQQGIYVKQDSNTAYQYYSLAIQSLKNIDNGTDKYIKYRLGSMYYKGLGTDIDLKKASQYFEESLSLGNENAYYPLGIIYSNPKDKLYDIKKGIYYLKMASDKNNPYASFKLGKIYEQIGEQEQSHINYCKSLKEFLALEKKEPKNPNLKQQLGLMYYRGFGTDIDFKKASQYFEESLNQGNSNVKYYLGMIYTTSGSPCYDIKKGIMLLEESSSDGNHYATCRLGDLYNFQLNDKTKALSYYKEASDNGSIYAQNQLLKMTFSNMNQNIRRNFHFEKALQYMKQSLKKDYESWKNILEHDRELQKALHQSDSNYDF